MAAGGFLRMAAARDASSSSIPSLSMENIRRLGSSCRTMMPYSLFILSIAALLASRSPIIRSIFQSNPHHCIRALHPGQLSQERVPVSIAFVASIVAISLGLVSIQTACAEIPSPSPVNPSPSSVVALTLT